MRAFVQRHRLVAFVILAYGLSWADWLPLLMRDARVIPGGAVTHFPGLLGPAVAAFIIVGVTEGIPGLGRLFRTLILVSKPSLRFAVYALSPLGFLALALAAAWFSGAALPPMRDFGLYSGLPPLPLLAALLLVLLFNGFGEETGWRGFALKRLQERFGPVTGTLILAIIWAGWHTPSFWFVEGYRTMGWATLIGGFGLGICAGAVVLARVLNQTGGSVLAASLWHATYNLTSATTASRGLIGAVTTTCVMVWASVLLIQEWRRPLAHSRLAAEATAAGGIMGRHD